MISNNVSIHLVAQEVPHGPNLTREACTIVQFLLVHDLYVQWEHVTDRLPLIVKAQMSPERVGGKY